MRRYTNIKYNCLLESNSAYLRDLLMKMGGQRLHRFIMILHPVIQKKQWSRRCHFSDTLALHRDTVEPMTVLVMYSCQHQICLRHLSKPSLGLASSLEIQYKAMPKQRKNHNDRKVDGFSFFSFSLCGFCRMRRRHYTSFVWMATSVKKASNFATF